MDQQGAGRTRSAADMRRPPSWPPRGGIGYGAGAETTGPRPVRSAVAPGSGAHRVLGPGTGPNRLIGADSGANPVLGRGTGAYRGYPQNREPADSFGPWFVPQDSLAGQHAAAAHPDDAELTMTLGRVPTGPPAGPPPGRRRGGRARRGRGSRIAWLTAAVVALAGAGFAGYKFLYVPRLNAPVPSTLRLPTTAPGSPGFDKALGKWQHIGSRSQDPQPLTIAALYPPQFTLNGKSYMRKAASATKTCSKAVYGADLQAALQTGKCTQVLRASYLSGDGTMMGTVGVVNLVSSNAAQKAGKATGPQQIIAPLTGKKGPTKKLGTGTGVVQAEIKGHYLILMWAEYANLKAPSGTAQRQALEKFAATLVTGSANINLSTRMLTGKP
jgi:hypothetical protein